MSWMTNIWRSLFSHEAIERDLNDELHSFVDEIAERKVRGGMPRKAAREEALLELGNPDWIKRQIREQRQRPARIAAALVSVGTIFFLLGVGTTAGVVRWGYLPWAQTLLTSDGSADGSDIRSRVPEKFTFHSEGDSQAGTVLRGQRPTIEGLVRDRETGQPVMNARVSLRSMPMVVSTTTDGDGRFYLEEAPPARYELVLGRTGWHVPLQTLQTPRSGVPHLLIEPADPASPYTITLTTETGLPVNPTARSFSVTAGGLQEMSGLLFDPSSSMIELDVQATPALRKRPYFR